MAVAQLRWTTGTAAAAAQWTGGGGGPIRMRGIEITVGGGADDGRRQRNEGRWGKSIFFLVL